MEKIDGYPHNGYPTDMGTDTGRIFIRVAPLTSLGCNMFNIYEIVWIKNKLHNKWRHKKVF